MDYREVLELTALVAVVLSAVHLLSPLVRERVRARARIIGPLSAGALAAYVFLHLLPSLGEGEARYGLGVTLVVLVGFVVYFALETFLSAHEHRLFRVKVGIGWGYSFLIIYSMPEVIEVSVLAAGLSAAALGTHVLQADNRLAWEKPAAFDRWGRWALATAPLAAVTSDFVLGPPSPQAGAYLSAFVSGVLLLSLFRDELSQHQDRRALPWFLLGVSAYGAVLVVEALLEQGVARLPQISTVGARR